MNFEAYLLSKKIDSLAFQKAEATLWEEWDDLFNQLSPSSFTAQKLYLINPIRRKYQLKEVAKEIKPTDSSAVETSAPAAKPKPVFKPKIK